MRPQDATLPFPEDEEENPYRAIARPLTEEMLAARENADKLRNAAQVARGGSTIAAAISGTKPDQGAAESLEARAALPEKRVAQDIEMGELARRIQTQQEPLDPNSRSSRRAQDVLLSTEFGRTLGMDKVRTMSQRDIEKATGVLKDDAGVALNRERFNADKDRAAKDLELRSKGLGETNRHNLAMEARPVGGRGPSTYQDAINQRRSYEYLAKMGSTTAKASDVVDGLIAIDRLAPGMTDGKLLNPEKFQVSPGDRALLMLPQGLGERFMDTNAVHVQTVLKNFQDLIQRVRSGAVLNEGEIKHYDELFRNKIFSDPVNAANTLKEMKSAIRRNLRDKQASFAAIPMYSVDDPQRTVLDEYEMQKGTTFRHPIFANVDDGSDMAAPAIANKPTPAPIPTATPVREPTATPTPGQPFTKDGKVLIIRKADGVPMWANPDTATKALGSKKYREVQNQVEFDALQKALAGAK